jgi:valyl-tRNA synthetase
VNQRSDLPSPPADLEGAAREVALAKAQMEIQGLSGRLANPNDADKAPPEVVVECRANLAEAEAQAELVRRLLAELAG